MNKLVAVASSLLLFGCLAWAQQSPPAEGVGLGNDHLSGNGTVSDIPSMSPDQNSVMTDTQGSVTGDKGISAFAGYSHNDTATHINSQGTLSVSESTSATAARREAYAGQHAVQSTQPNVTWSSAGSAVAMAQNAGGQNPAQNAADQKGAKSKTAQGATGQNGNAAGPKTTGKLSGLNEGPSNTEAPGPHTGVPPANPPAKQTAKTKKKPATGQQQKQ